MWGPCTSISISSFMHGESGGVPMQDVSIHTNTTYFRNFFPLDHAHLRSLFLSFQVHLYLVLLKSFLYMRSIDLTNRMCGFCFWEHTMVHMSENKQNIYADRNSCNVVIRSSERMESADLIPPPHLWIDLCILTIHRIRFSRLFRDRLFVSSPNIIRSFFKCSLFQVESLRWNLNHQNTLLKFSSSSCSASTENTIKVSGRSK